MNKRIQYIAIGIIVVLVMTNLGMLAGIWLGPHFGGPAPSHPGSRMGNFLQKELNLSRDQMEEFREVGETHQREMQYFHRETTLLKERMYNLLKEGKAENEVRYIADEIGVLHSKRELQTYRHFYELRELCDEEQKEKFDQLIQQVIQITSPPPPRGRQHTRQ